MNQKLWISNDSENGDPTGGFVIAQGINITWQNGQLGRGENRKEPNGAFVEGVIESALQRLRYYQESKFKCEENSSAIVHLEWALKSLNDRTKGREKREVEGTHKV